MNWFYDIQLVVHGCLLVAALWLNRGDPRMIALTIAVGAGFYAPIISTENPALWYFQCFIVEMLVAMLAAFLNVGTASVMVIWMSFILGVAHFTGIFIGPHPGFGPYRATVPILELTQCLVCIVMSKGILDMARKTKSRSF